MTDSTSEILPPPKMEKTKTLPNEILIMIIQQSIEPYNISIEPIYTGTDAIYRHHSGFKVNGFSQAANLRLVNRGFNAEVMKALEDKYAGQLTFSRLYNAQYHSHQFRALPWQDHIVKHSTTKLRYNHGDLNTIFNEVGTHYFPNLLSINHVYNTERADRKAREAKTLFKDVKDFVSIELYLHIRRQYESMRVRLPPLPKGVRRLLRYRYDFKDKIVFLEATLERNLKAPTIVAIHDKPGISPHTDKLAYDNTP